MKLALYILGTVLAAVAIYVIAVFVAAWKIWGRD